MWIRSQDKTKLVEVKNKIDYRLYLNKYYEIYVNDIYVGAVSTAEDALEMLEDLQNSIQYHENNVGYLSVIEIPMWD